MDCATLRPQHGHHHASPHLAPPHEPLQQQDHHNDHLRISRPQTAIFSRQNSYNMQDAQMNEPYQYAFPIRTTPGHYQGGIAGHELHDNVLSENMLRRKTPSGTLNNAYHSSSQDINPMKHLVIPSFPTQPSHQNKMSLPQMDSMLQQGSTRPLQYHNFQGQTVPSVLQPSAHHIGPTASGIDGRGPYGPYWHDGTFIPYRPTALRDPRFYHDAAYPYSHYGTNPALHRSPAHGQMAPPLAYAFTQPFDTNEPFDVPVSTFFKSAQHSRHSGHSRYPGPALQQTHNPSISASPSGWSVSVPQSTPYYTQSNESTQYQTSMNVSTTVHPPLPNLTSVQHRERTFYWALQIYRDLLAFVHHTRKFSHHNAPHGDHSHSRNGFYPKPPSSTTGHAPRPTDRRTNSDSSIFEATRAAQRQSEPSVVQTNAGLDLAMPKQFTSNVIDASRRSSQPIQYQASIPRRELYAKKHPHLNQKHAWPYPQAEPHDNYRTLRRSSGLLASSMGSLFTPQLSPVFQARSALSSLVGLCGETDWQWIDGLNLGGCLAYGLGDYQRALDLYTRVIELDSRHLEAISNVAATLVALGRRQEAEQHWLKVVKHAPNHFEAVEHLVGLLCSTHRAKDAIKIIDHVQRSLKIAQTSDAPKAPDHQSETSSSASRSPCISDISDRIFFDFDNDGESYGKDSRDAAGSNEPGFGSSGYAIPGYDNGRILSLVHAKGNMLYSQGDNVGAARAFEDAVLIATGRKYTCIRGLVKHVLSTISASASADGPVPFKLESTTEPILLHPEQAVRTAHLCYAPMGELPGLVHVPGDPSTLAKKAAISTTSNSLLSLAKIFQDSMSTNARNPEFRQLVSGVRDILALYYLSLALQPSPSTANNVGILLAGVQHSAPAARSVAHHRNVKADIPGVVPGSGVALALAYYNYGLLLDARHAHLYTNLGSLLKDIGQLDAAIDMYKRAVSCDGNFDIALANLANAVKDKGRISEAIDYYKRAVRTNPNFAEAVCGLANALNSVCSWTDRGGIAHDGGRRDRWHVDASGMLLDATHAGARSSGWMKNVVDIVEKQLLDGEEWGGGVLTAPVLEDMVQSMVIIDGDPQEVLERQQSFRETLGKWAGSKWEGARIVRLVERAIRHISWHWYHDKYVKKKERALTSYTRPKLPTALTIPSAPTVLPFHTFTCPMSAEQVRLISQRNGYRISASTLRTPWLPEQVYPPPRPPNHQIKVGYVSSDFNNHPLAHLMQSVFGLHNTNRIEAYCYATTASDNSVHRRQIEAEAPYFFDASSWSTEHLVQQIVQDGIHILVNLNGYTRGARNEVFAARPAPIQMSFMGFAGTLGAEWCDYLLADDTAIPPSTLRPWRRNVDLQDQFVDENSGGVDEKWVYGENIIFCRDTFFCCDHKQSAPDSHEKRLSWDEEQSRRWQMRKELFPSIADDTIIFGNFNQLYKIEPTTFRTWLRILSRVRNSILWLLRFPDLGEANLKRTAELWAGHEVASRVIFTDVAPKHLHISRARVCDLFLDTAECNAHTTAADVLWSGTPLLTLPRYNYKMCSRMAASILRGALPKNAERAQADKDLVANSEDEYEELAVKLGTGLRYPRSGSGQEGRGEGRLMELRKMLTAARWNSALFDTKRWVSDLEDAYEEAWRRWVAGEGGDIWLDQIPKGGMQSK